MIINKFWKKHKLLIKLCTIFIEDNFFYNFEKWEKKYSVTRFFRKENDKWRKVNNGCKTSMNNSQDMASYSKVLVDTEQYSEMQRKSGTYSLLGRSAKNRKIQNYSHA